MKYLTLAQLKNTDEGLPLTGITDVALARIIAAAETDIDAYMGFDPKLGGFEPKNVLFQTLWDNDRHRVDIPNECLPVRQVLRFDIQLSNISTTGAGFEAIIQPNDVAINNFEEYMQIIPLSAITYSMFPTIIGMGLDPAIVVIEIATGYYVPIFNEIFVDSGDHMTYWSLRGFWATTLNLAPSLLAKSSSVIPVIPAQIQVNGAAPGVSYTTDPLNGSVTFATPLAASSTVTGSFATQIPDFVRETTIAQVYFYLRQRLLAQTGTYPETKRIRNGDQEIMMQDRDKQVRGMNGSLCAEAAGKLASLEEIGIA